MTGRIEVTGYRVIGFGPGLLLSLTDRSGRAGFGEASPLPGYSPDSIEDANRALKRIGGVSIDPDRPLLAQLATATRSASASPAARFAIETALLDLCGQARDQSIAALLRPSVDGERARRVELSSLVADIDGARRAFDRGVRTFKVKVGGDRLAPGAALLRALREEFADRVHLRADANRKWSAAEARGNLDQLVALDLELVEEPCADFEAIGTPGIRIAVDESLADNSAENLADDRVGAIVLKPMLLGGYGRCIELANRARARGLEPIVTHMMDGPVGLAAAAELALAIGPRLACGLDRHARLAEFPALDVPQLRPHSIASAGRPGLGTAPPSGPLSVFAAASDAPARVAVVADQARLTYRELCEPVAAELARLRESGVTGPRTPATVVADRSVNTLVTLLALLELGAPIILSSPRVHNPELGDLPPGSGAVVFTSGSGGAPKPVVLGRDALIASAAASASNLGWRHGDRWLCCLPLAHVGGLSIALRCLAGRRCIVLDTGAGFESNRIANTVQDARVTLMSLVPTMLHRLLEADWQPPRTLRAVLIGGAAASAALLEQAAERGVPTLTTYGMSETASQICTQRLGEARTADGDCGVPLPGIHIAIGDDRRIRVRGPVVMLGYAPLDSQPAGDGWFTTGDCGYLDDGGHLHVTGRADDAIVTGGENVDPVSVERVLEGHPAIRAACVFGVPDAEWGEIVAAALVVGGTGPADLGDYLRGRLSACQLPRRICLVPRLAESPTGKLDRPAIARAAASRLYPLT